MFLTFSLFLVQYPDLLWGIVSWFPIITFGLILQLFWAACYSLNIDSITPIGSAWDLTLVIGLESRSRGRADIMQGRFYSLDLPALVELLHRPSINRVGGLSSRAGVSGQILHAQSSGDLGLDLPFRFLNGIMWCGSVGGCTSVWLPFLLIGPWLGHS